MSPDQKLLQIIFISSSSHPFVTVLVGVGYLSVSAVRDVVAGEVVVETHKRQTSLVHVAVPPFTSCTVWEIHFEKYILRHTRGKPLSLTLQFHLLHHLHRAQFEKIGSPVRCRQWPKWLAFVLAASWFGDFIGSCHKVNLRREVEGRRKNEGRRPCSKKWGLLTRQWFSYIRHD